MSLIRSLMFSAAFGLLGASQAMAACSSPSGSEGHVRYNKPDKKLYFCDGVNWVSPGGGETASGGSYSGWDPIGPPQVGTNGGETVSLCQGLVGTACGGGVFAGDGNLILAPAGCDSATGTCTGVDGSAQRKALYPSSRVKTKDADTQYPNLDSSEYRIWGDVNNRYGYRLSEALKVGNAYNPTGISPAHKWCTELTYGGYSDWYLPTSDEMETIMDNMREIVDNAPVTYRFRTSTSDIVTDTGCCNGYWSGNLAATDSGRAEARYYNMSIGANNGAKVNMDMYARCVRRN